MKLFKVFMRSRIYDTGLQWRRVGHVGKSMQGSPLEASGWRMHCSDDGAHCELIVVVAVGDVGGSEQGSLSANIHEHLVCPC